MNEAEKFEKSKEYLNELQETIMGDQKLSQEDITKALWYFSIILISSLDDKTRQKIDQSLFGWSWMIRAESEKGDDSESSDGVAFLLLGIRYVCFLAP